MVKLLILPDSSQTGAHQQTTEVRGLRQQVRAHADMSDALPPYLICAHQSFVHSLFTCRKYYVSRIFRAVIQLIILILINTIYMSPSEKTRLGQKRDKDR